MLTLFEQIAHRLPANYQSAVPIVVVAPRQAGKSCLLLAFAQYVQQNHNRLNLSPVVWSEAIVKQWKSFGVRQQGTTPTPSMDQHEIEYIGFLINGQPFVMIAVAGEDLMTNGVDPSRVTSLLRDAIVVLAFHPLLCLVDYRSTPAQFAIRSLAYQISQSFGLSAEEAFRTSLTRMLSFDLVSGFNQDYDELQPILEGAAFEYQPTGPTPESRFPIIHPGVENHKLQQCDLAITEVIESVVAQYLPAQRQLEDALANHPRVIRKIVRLDLLELAPANGVFPDDILRQRLGLSTKQITVGGADVRSRLQHNRPGLMVIEGPHTAGPEQLIKAIELMANRDRSLQPHRKRAASVAGIITGTAACSFVLGSIAFGFINSLAFVGTTTLACGLAFVFWLCSRVPFRTRRSTVPMASALEGTKSNVASVQSHPQEHESHEQPVAIPTPQKSNGTPRSTVLRR